MRSFKKIKLIAITLLCSGVAIWTGCQKDGGVYSKLPEKVDFTGNAYEYLKSKPGVYDSLLKAVDALGYASILRDSDITLFAVPNGSFKTALLNLNTQRSQANKLPLDLSTLNLAFSRPNVGLTHLDSMVAMYIIRGKHIGDSLDFQDPVALRSVKFGLPMNARLRVSPSSGFNKGGSQYLEFNLVGRTALGAPSLFQKDWALSTTGAINIKTKNAVVHELTPSHVFGFDEFVFRYSYVPPPPNLFKTLAAGQTDTIYRFGGKHTVSHYSPHGLSEYFERVYDGDVVSKFYIPSWNDAKSEGFWLKFKPRIPTVADAYTLVSADDDPARDPKNWKMEGSMDDINWVVLDTKFNEIFPRRQMTRVFYFPNKVAYAYYRITFVENNGSGGWQIADYTLNSTLAE